MKNKTTTWVVAYAIIQLSAAVFFVGCGRSSTSSQEGISKRNLVNVGMTRKEVEDILGKPMSVYCEGDTTMLWYSLGLSKEDLMKPGLKVEAYVVAITNGVVRNCFEPMQ